MQPQGRSRHRGRDICTLMTQTKPHTAQGHMGKIVDGTRPATTAAPEPSDRPESRGHPCLAALPEALLRLRRGRPVPRTSPLTRGHRFPPRLPSPRRPWRSSLRVAGRCRAGRRHNLTFSSRIANRQDPRGSGSTGHLRSGSPGNNMDLRSASVRRHASVVGVASSMWPHGHHTRPAGPASPIRRPQLKTGSGTRAWCTGWSAADATTAVATGIPVALQARRSWR